MKIVFVIREKYVLDPQDCFFTTTITIQGRRILETNKLPASLFIRLPIKSTKRLALKGSLLLFFPDMFKRMLQTMPSQRLLHLSMMEVTALITRRGNVLRDLIRRVSNSVTFFNP
jgi:hypothetical protein